METNKIKLASAANYFNDLREEGLAEEKRNEGSVWTMIIDGTSHVTAAGLAEVEYNLKLNCSHVGETPYGVYRGTMDFSFKGDCSGAYAILALLGMKTQDDLEGWFRNDSFVMKLKPFDEQDESEFIETFDQSSEEAAEENALETQFKNSLVSALVTGGEKDERKASGIWYDWSHHMTEGDMSTYAKITGGILPFYGVNGYGKTDAKGSTLDVDATAFALFGGIINKRYNKPIDSPFPYTLKTYENGDVLFTLYNAKGGPVTVTWRGKLTSIPVEDTIVVK